MTGPIDKAFVEIEPDIDNFDRDVDKKLNKTFKDVEKSLDKTTNHIEDEFKQLERLMSRVFDEVGDQAEDAFDRIQREAGDAEVAIDIGIGGATIKAKRDIDDMADKATKDLKRIQREAKQTSLSLSAMFSKLGIGKVISSLGGPVKGLAAAGGITAGLLSTLGPLHTMLMAVVSAVSAVWSSLMAAGPALAVLPALAAGAALVFFTIKSLGPAMLKVLEPIGKAFKDNQKDVDALATKGLPELAKAFVKVNFPAIATAQENIARSTNHILTNVGKWINSIPGQQLIRELTSATSDAMLTLEKPLSRVVISFLELVKRVGGDPLRSTADTIARLATKTAEWIDTLSKDDVKNAIEEIKMWGQEAQNAWEKLKGFGTWLDENTQKVRNFSNGLAAAGLALGIATGNIPAILASSFTLIFNNWEQIKSLFKSVPAFFTKIWDDVKNNSGAQQVFKSLKEAWDGFIKGFNAGFSSNNFKNWIKEIKESWNEWAPIIAFWWLYVGKPMLTAFGFALGGIITILLALSSVAHNVFQTLGAALKLFVFGALVVFGTFIEAAARAFGWLPGIGPKLKAARDDFFKFAADVNRSLAGIHDKTINVTVKYREVGRNVISQNQYESGIGGRAGGGPIKGGQTYMTGEEGYELITPTKDAWVWNHKETKDMLNGSKLPMDSMREPKSTPRGDLASQASGFNGTIIVQLGDEQITNPVVKIMHNNSQEVALAAESGNTQLGRRR